MSSCDIRKPTPLLEKAMLFVIAFAVVAAVQTLAGWWLNSGTGVLRTVLVLAALGVFAAFRRSGTLWMRACALWAGAISAMAVVLFWTGPGTIWPIVLVFAAAISGGAVLGGALLGAAAVKLRG